MDDIPKTLGVVIAILVTIIIGVMIYWNIADSGQMGVVSSIQTASNGSGDVVTSRWFNYTLSYNPASASEVNVTMYNSTVGPVGCALSYVPTANISVATNRIMLSIGVSNNDSAGTSYYRQNNFTQHNITYYTDTGVVVRRDINPNSQTIFTLAPLIGIVMIAAVVLSIIVLFGATKPGGGI